MVIKLTLFDKRELVYLQSWSKNYYRMSDASFWKLHNKLKENIDKKSIMYQGEAARSGDRTLFQMYSYTHLCG